MFEINYYDQEIYNKILGDTIERVNNFLGSIKEGSFEQFWRLRDTYPAKFQRILKPIFESRLNQVLFEYFKQDWLSQNNETLKSIFKRIVIDIFGGL